MSILITIIVAPIVFFKFKKKIQRKQEMKEEKIREMERKREKEEREKEIAMEEEKCPICLGVVSEIFI
jgi:phosphate/sulfate permease